MATALLGRQTPRLQLTPPEAYNLGDDAIEFARRIGIPLDPWQKLAIRNGMGRRADGSPAAFRVGLIAQRQNGKGSITDVVELYALFVIGLPVVVHSAHRLDTSQKAFRVVKGIIERSPDLARRCLPINDSDAAIELLGGGRLEFRTRTKSGGRGLTGDLLVLDEALELTDEQIAAIVPILAARPDAQIWYTSTVPQFREQHLVELRRQAMDGVERLAYVEWGVDGGATPAETLRILADPVKRAEANPAYGTRLTAERLEDLRRILGDEKFGTECMGIWPEMAAGAVLDPAHWARLTDRESRRDGDVVLMIDITPMRDHATIGLYGQRADGLEHVQIVDYRPGTGWIVDRLRVLVEALDPLAVVVDERNGAHALLPQLAEVGIKVPEDPEKPRRGDVLVLGTQQMADAVGQFIDLVRTSGNSGLRHQGQEPLDAAVRGAKARTIGDAGQIAWGRRASEVDIGPLVAVTGARYGWHTWRELVTAEYDPLANIG